jgi:hypothetical protein
MPIVGQLKDNTRNMAFLCNAMQFEVHCRIAGLVGTHVPGEEHSKTNLLGQHCCPFPVVAGRDKQAQLFGLAASIAARLTIWPISLACSASDRICACTYSLCNRMISVRSLACSSDCA